MLKLLSLFMIKVYYKVNDIMKGFGIKCINRNKIVGCGLKNQSFIKVFTIFFKAILSRNFFSLLDYIIKGKNQLLYLVAVPYLDSK